MMDATFRERLVSTGWIIASGLVISLSTGLQPMYAVLIAAVMLAAVNVVYWRARGVALSEVYGW